MLAGLKVLMNVQGNEYFEHSNSSAHTKRLLVVFKGSS
jgi:hypothetical protein